MVRVIDGRFDVVARLLQDPRVQASVNARSLGDSAALYYVCVHVDKPGAPAIIQLLLQAGADLNLTNTRGETPLVLLQRDHPAHPPPSPFSSKAWTPRRPRSLSRSV